jgi:hypothetical protein
MKRFLHLVLIVAALLSMALTFSACDDVKLWLTPTSVKYISATEKTFTIEVEGISAGTYVTHVEIKGPDKASFSFIGGVSNCEGGPIGNGTACTEKIKLSTYKTGLSAELEVKVGGLRKVSQLTT